MQLLLLKDVGLIRNHSKVVLMLQILARINNISITKQETIGLEDSIILDGKISITNYPNPFKPSGAGRRSSTTISFSTADTRGLTQINIYNLKGQKIRQYSTFNNQFSIIWNGTNENNNPVSSGIYLYKLKSGKFISTKKMILMK